MVDVAEDAFEENVIKAKLEALEKTAKEKDETKKMVIPEMAKHFLVFIATTWQSGQKHQFLVAWYALSTIKAPFLVREIKKNALLLSFYGFIMDTIVGDGASENRSAWKMLADISARDILLREWTEEELEGLPLDFNIGFAHPHPEQEVSKGFG